MAIKTRKGVITHNNKKTHLGQPVRLTKYYGPKHNGILCPLNPETGDMYFKANGDVVTYMEYTST